MTRITRRDLIRLGAGLAGGRLLTTELHAQRDRTAAGKSLQPAFRALDAFVRAYMRAMDAPGMTLVLADRGGIVRIATYGVADIDRGVPVTADHLFEIGSISKSFVAIAVLQLADEKKIDLHAPIADFMPWLKVESHFAPITVHHLLAHTSGLPESLNCLLSDPAARLRTRYAPGDHFHYCNLAYQALGYLIWQAGGRPFADAIRDRIFKPIGMNSSEPIIDGDTRRHEPRSYNPWFEDRPFAPGRPLKTAGPLIMDDAAGSIASTPHDMGLYVQMIANRGAARGTRLLSERSFDRFTAAHTKAEAFGPGVSYGYGLMIDTLDGHKVVRHTGGMVSFASSMQVDLDEGVGVFASINAMQGYRPNPVAQYALRLMRAANAGEPLPKTPDVVSPAMIAGAGDYAGLFRSPSGKSLEFVAHDKALAVIHNGKRHQVEQNGGAFSVRDGELGRFAFNFQRNKDGPVTDLIHGSDWYAGERYAGPRDFTVPAAWRSYTGHYRNDSPWSGSFRVVVAKGRLWLNGVTPLEPDGDAAFWLNDPEYSPDRIEFFNAIAGLCMQAKLSGQDYWRVLTNV